MISIELAKQLSEKGLIWEPKFGDMYCFSCREGSSIYCFDEGISSILNARQFCSTWLPSLSQMLGEIGKNDNFHIDLMGSESTGFNLRIIGKELEGNNCVLIRWGKTAEEAVGKALLWILEQEGKNA